MMDDGSLHNGVVEPARLVRTTRRAPVTPSPREGRAGRGLGRGARLCSSDGGAKPCQSTPPAVVSKLPPLPNPLLQKRRGSVPSATVVVRARCAPAVAKDKKLEAPSSKQQGMVTGQVF